MVSRCASELEVHCAICPRTDRACRRRPACGRRTSRWRLTPEICPFKSHLVLLDCVASDPRKPERASACSFDWDDTGSRRSRHRQIRLGSPALSHPVHVPVPTSIGCRRCPQAHAQGGSDTCGPAHARPSLPLGLQASAQLHWHMAAAVAMPAALGNASPSCSIAAYDVAQQTALRQELTIIHQKYFTPESTVPGLPIDPDGGAGRAAAQGKQHRHMLA